MRENSPVNANSTWIASEKVSQIGCYKRCSRHIRQPIGRVSDFLVDQDQNLGNFSPNCRIELQTIPVMI